MADIKLIEVEKYFGKNYVIRKLNLEIEDREFLVLLGHPDAAKPQPCVPSPVLKRSIPGK